MPEILEKPRSERRTEVVENLPDSRARRNPRWVWALGAVLLLVAAVAAWRLMAKPAAPTYATAAVERGTVRKAISATGKLQALTTVQVGTQVSGTIAQISADYNDRVKKGQVIALLDQSQLQAQLTQALATQASALANVQTARASLQGAQAAVEAGEANVERLQSLVEDAQQNLERTRQLVNERIGARRDLEVAQNTYNQAVAQKQQGVAQVTQARAQVASSTSQVAQAQAQLSQAQASVELAGVNLQHATITAPIDGVIVARNVDVGQTVAASLQAPTLFLLANDLTRMQVLADIDEADVGQLQPEGAVAFTVDAYPSETFEGRISQIRLSPQTVQNVTTYTAVIDVANPDLKLKPGMTANVTVTVDERQNVLTVPNGALRYKPENAAAPRGGGSVVWRAGGENGQLEAVPVKLGLTDGVTTEVVSGGLREGDIVAVAGATNQATTQRTNNPFMPSRPGARGGARK